MVCELAGSCPRFNDRASCTPEILALYRVRYCKGSFGDCARYAVYQALGRDAVPDDMFPNDALSAQRLIASRTAAIG